MLIVSLEMHNQGSGMTPWHVHAGTHKIVCSEDTPTSEEHSTGSSGQVKEACACCMGGRTNASDQERIEPMSSNMVVMTFSNEYTAEQVRDRLVELQKAHLIKVDDAVVVVRSQDGKVKIKQAANLAGAGALSGAFWGMLIGLICLVPFLGMAVGAAIGAVAGSIGDCGIDDNFIKEVGNAIQPGTSALFVLVQQVTVDKVVEQLRPFGGNIVRTSLSTENEAQLKAAFGQE
jgi:uncharacterized membrane protein